jgi:hypothetical protein
MSIFAEIFIIGIGIAALVIIFSRYCDLRQNNTRGLHTRFAEAAAAFHLSITKQEVLRGRMIGLDDKNNKLLFLEAHKDKHDGYLVGLDEIKACVVTKTYGAIREDSLDGSSLESYVNTIALRLDYTNGANSTFLTFYDRATYAESEMRERAEQAKAWQKLLSTRLAGKYDKVEESKIPAKRTFASRIEEGTSLLRLAENTGTYKSRHSSFSL